MHNRQRKRNRQLVEKKPDFHYPEFNIPTGIIRADLTRTAIVTILALLLLFGLYAYLQHDGWQKVLSMLSGLSL